MVRRSANFTLSYISNAASLNFMHRLVTMEGTGKQGQVLLRRMSPLLFLLGHTRRVAPRLTSRLIPCNLFRGRIDVLEQNVKETTTSPKDGEEPPHFCRLVNMYSNL